MTFRTRWLLVPLLLASIEGGVQAWRLTGLIPSKAPVFHWSGAPLVTTARPPLGPALELYRADRGAEKTVTLPQGRKLVFFYFEWDRIDLGIFNVIGGHEAEKCNVEYGSFKLLQSGGERIRKFANGETMNFDYTMLEDQDGKPVHVYKIPWVQGYGKWSSKDKDERLTHIRRSFLCHRGAARVIEAGISGVDSENEAWEIFQHEILDQLEWVR